MPFRRKCHSLGRLVVVVHNQSQSLGQIWLSGIYSAPCTPSKTLPFIIWGVSSGWKLTGLSIQVVGVFRKHSYRCISLQMSLSSQRNPIGEEIEETSMYRAIWHCRKQWQTYITVNYWVATLFIHRVGAGNDEGKAEEVEKRIFLFLLVRQRVS